jgi:hypothetical protein
VWQSHGNGFNGDAVGTIRAKRARSAASSATRGRVYIFVNSRRIREFLPRLRPAQIEPHNFLPSQISCSDLDWHAMS